MNKTYSIKITPDDDGLLGRECPNKECEGYFKLQPGTGLSDNVSCHCPYCGYVEDQNSFWTKEQIEYAKSVVFNDVGKQISKMFKSFGKNQNRNSIFSLRITYKEKQLPPIRYYREKKLEQVVVCTNCTLRYALYGVFGFCPDCGIHNSLQIYNANLDIVEKMLNLNESINDTILKEKILENALEDLISSFDGFGREICKINSQKAKNIKKIQNISFQNIVNADKALIENFKFGISTIINNDDWLFIRNCFEKRHLISHKMGVIDEKYIGNTLQNSNLIGHKVSISVGEVKKLSQYLQFIADNIFKSLSN